MKKILITGGAGFIGSNFTRYFLNKYSDYRIVNLDKLTYAGNRDNLRDIEKDPRYTFVKGDICSMDTVEKAAKGCQAIINFAAETHVDRSIIKPDDFINTNIRGVHRLLEITNKYKIPKFVQISTDEVYGSRIKGYFKEGDSLSPSSPYSASKAAADLLCYSYYVTYKTPVMITRSTNNFGQFHFPEKVIPLFITNAIDNKALPVYADGMNRRDWIYVLDNCEAVDCVFRKGKPGEIYNIAGGNEMANIRLTRLVLRMMNKPDKLIKFVKDRPGHDKRYALNCSKIKRLGWRPKYDFEEALKITVQWYKKNEWWWRPLRIL